MCCPLKSIFLRRSLRQRWLLVVARIVVCCFTFWVSICGSLVAADDVPASSGKALGYNRDIRPILAEYCFACHGPDSAARKADLRLDVRDAAVESGAIVPGKAEESEILARLVATDPEVIMPPPHTKKTVSPEDRETLRRWLSEGAPYEAHWSFLVPLRPSAPQAQPPADVQTNAWVKNDIDRFVLAGMQARGLEPSPEAPPQVLFRRLHLDITGLPPTPAAVDEFVAQYPQDPDGTLSLWIDRLMQSTAWGEHRARYWLDAARYGDTHGLHFDNYREIWPYRDWVIRAFNENQPFDQFTIDQIAGDLLPDPTEDQLIATGFQRCNITTNEGGTIEEENLANYAADRVQTFGWVYLGLTTNCAQCHDHKFDPISAQDYYALAAFFRNTTQGALDGNTKDGRGPVIMVPTPEDLPRWQELPGLISEAAVRRDARRTAARDDFDRWLATAGESSLDADLPKEGLVFHALLNEGTGKSVSVSFRDAASDPASPLQSIAIQAASDITWEAGGKFGSAPVLKSESTFQIPNVGDFRRDQAFSYGAWVRAGRDNVSGAILARMDQQGAHRGWDLWQQGRNVAAHIIEAWPENALKVVSQDAVLDPAKWQHLFVTYDGSGKAAGVQMYLDGKAIPLRTETDTLKPEANIQTTTPLRLGQRSDNQFFEDGRLQDVRIYSQALTAPQVRAVAEVAPIGELLAIDPAQRTEEQNKALYDYYLHAQDSQYPQLASAVAALEAERESVRARSPVTHVQKERMDSQPMTNILMRGEYDRKGDTVQAATPAALHPFPADAPRNRLGLARWLVDPANSLTARVTVNRFWQQVFGNGIVVTAEDFGIMGMLPTHPELLDYLAVEFRESGWDVKRFFKLMLMSATYRQSAEVTAAKLEVDPNNAFLSRGPRFRLDAEMIRDLALASSGLLSSKMYGPGVRPYQPEAIWDIVGLPGGDTRNYVQSTGDDLYRRTVYSFWKRMAPPPNLEAFNAPSREVCTIRRERTNTPLQALVTLNDPQFVESARVLAQNALTQGADDQAKIVRFIARQVLARDFSEAERKIVIADFEHYLQHYQQHAEDAKALITVGQAPNYQSHDPVSLASWTLVCNQVLNLDEAINK